MENKTPEGRKDDQEKPDWNLLPFAQVQQVVDVLTYGKKKYGADNWKRVKDASERYFSAAMRHLTSWQSGERLDPETGLSHLAHACCDLLFNMWFDDQAIADTKQDTQVITVSCECGGEMKEIFDFNKNESSLIRKSTDYEIIQGKPSYQIIGVGYECEKCKRTVLIAHKK